MLFQYPKTKKIVEVLGDLVRIQNDRLTEYKDALDCSDTEPYLNDAIRNVIQSGVRYKDKLIHKMRQLDGQSGEGMEVPGKLYKVWSALKIKMKAGNRKNVLASCQYNESIALHVSGAAAGNADLGPDIRKLIEEQEEILKQNVNLIRLCGADRRFAASGALYFN